MLRRSLMLGLTLMLGVVLVWLIINGHKEEVRQKAAPTEIVKDAGLSATRVVAPTDLEVSESRPPGAANTKTPAGVEIRNRGKLAYRNIMLQVTCLGADGKVLDTRTRLVVETVAPGQSLTLSDLALESIPRGTARFGFSILYGDLDAAAKTNEGMG
jgi:hypothetical protein